MKSPKFLNAPVESFRNSKTVSFFMPYSIDIILVYIILPCCINCFIDNFLTWQLYLYVIFFTIHVAIVSMVCLGLVNIG